jgi:hypothetical protein
MGDIGKIQKRKRSGGHGRPRAVGPARVTGSGASPSARTVHRLPTVASPTWSGGRRPSTATRSGPTRRGAERRATRVRNEAAHEANQPGLVPLTAGPPGAVGPRDSPRGYRAHVGERPWANKITWYSLCRGIKKT